MGESYLDFRHTHTHTHKKLVRNSFVSIGGKWPEANVLVYSCGSGRDSSLNIFHLLKSYSSLCVPFSVGAVRPDGTETQKFM